jgi:hypothetical protein
MPKHPQHLPEIAFGHGVALLQIEDAGNAAHAMLS